MAGKVLTKEDFTEGSEPQDTSQSIPADEKVVVVDEKVEVKGKEEPEEKTEPSEKVKEELLPEPSEEKKYKYASMDEFDKAYKEAEKKMHEATTKASELERKVSYYEKPIEKPITIDDRMKEMTKETLAKIKVLPADSPTRDEDAGYEWAKLQRNISRLDYEETQRNADKERQVVTKTYERATKEGIKTDAELRILGYEFSKTDSNLSTEERISQAVDSTKGVLSQIREGLVEKQEKDKKEKEDLKVLGRGSSRTVKSEEKDKGPTTMSEQLADLNEKRKLKKDDIFR